MAKVTWWVSSLPSETLAVLSDAALLETIKTSLAATRVLRRGGDLPAVGRMWENNVLALHVYGGLACMEASHRRGLDDDSFAKFGTPGKQMAADGVQFEMPPWYQDEDVQISHIAGIQREGLWRNEEARIELDEEDEFWPMLWPVATEGGGYELMVNKKDREAMAVDDLWLPDEVRSRVVNL